MSDLRKEFEALPEIAKLIETHKPFYRNGWYECNNSVMRGFINGAYYAFQEQQKEIDDLALKIESKDHSARECLSAMSLSCASCLREQKDLKEVISEINTYLQSLSEKHLSTHGYLGVLDILEKHKELLK